MIRKIGDFYTGTTENKLDPTTKEGKSSTHRHRYIGAFVDILRTERKAIKLVSKDIEKGMVAKAGSEGEISQEELAEIKTEAKKLAQKKIADKKKELETEKAKIEKEETVDAAEIEAAKEEKVVETIEEVDSVTAAAQQAAEEITETEEVTAKEEKAIELPEANKIPKNVDTKVLTAEEIEAANEEVIDLIGAFDTPDELIAALNSNIHQKDNEKGVLIWDYHDNRNDAVVATQALFEKTGNKWKDNVADVNRYLNSILKKFIADRKAEAAEQAA